MISTAFRPNEPSNTNSRQAVLDKKLLAKTTVGFLSSEGSPPFNHSLVAAHKKTSTLFEVPHHSSFGGQQKEKDPNWKNKTLNAASDDRTMSSQTTLNIIHDNTGTKDNRKEL